MYILDNSEDLISFILIIAKNFIIDLVFFCHIEIRENIIFLLKI